MIEVRGVAAASYAAVFSNSRRVSYYDEGPLKVDRSRWDFFAELAQFGPVDKRMEYARWSAQITPAGTSRPIGDASGGALAAAEAYCRSVAHRHYENFQIASWFVPKHLRQDFANIYAYCRWSDDCADEAGSRTAAMELLTWWQGELDSLFRGETPRHPVMQALATTVERHRLPPNPFFELLSAFSQDQVKQRYETHDEVLDYCQRSANPVGQLVLGLAHAADDAENLRLSDHICTGLQLANFCQDMARDAAMGRIYAPRELWAEHRVDEAMLLAARPTPELRSLLEQWVALAREQLEAGEALVQRAPRWLAVDVRLFRAGGRAILDQIERAHFDVWTRRPTVSKTRKLQLLLSACLGIA